MIRREDITSTDAKEWLRAAWTPVRIAGLGVFTWADPTYRLTLIGAVAKGTSVKPGDVGVGDVLLSDFGLVRMSGTVMLPREGSVAQAWQQDRTVHGFYCAPLDGGRERTRKVSELRRLNLADVRNLARALGAPVEVHRPGTEYERNNGRAGGPDTLITTVQP